MPDIGVQVLVKFPSKVPIQHQGPALLHMEMELRRTTGLDVRVEKDLMGDDSKLRKLMTIVQREKL